MANTKRTLATPAAAVLLLLIAAAAVELASASTLTAFSGPACAGKTKDINGCGCFDISAYHSGFHFVFTQGQAARLYTKSQCKGTPYDLKKETRKCGPNDFKSIRMIC
ncbi:unnamed protein product [Spirodela intermedia]|uniref:Uncharacterized protein n=2 Tax=Spirodela intermedia TaxID=51605 RepID=A0A7I8K9J1_SPIIN|nr:unnamed protein product [Spirodela intermedia]CAA6658109.1 unnamed protein product [Spirodela intermedia]CAA6674543.1 unnamed protein product [Spirodela intermedia]CAA6674564.1 unnamed protein product [Spirodela intermedia]CAA7394242.1 unnamed protein product [Spirodela intermedia]